MDNKKRRDPLSVSLETASFPGGGAEGDRSQALQILEQQAEELEARLMEVICDGYCKFRELDQDGLDLCCDRCPLHDGIRQLRDTCFRAGSLEAIYAMARRR